MVWQQTSDDATFSPTTPVRAARGVSSPGRGDLPRWESFPPQDRRLLVGLLVQTARRQVRSQPMVRVGQASR